MFSGMKVKATERINPIPKGGVETLQTVDWSVETTRVLLLAMICCGISQTLPVAFSYAKLVTLL